ncbi:MAG: hypothetical protein WDM96_17270 [Lacunisphaera sp.]
MTWNISYELPWKQYGRFHVSSNWEILQSFDLDGTEYAGNDLYGTLPKFRAYSTLDWTYKGYGATLGYTRVNNRGCRSGDSRWQRPRCRSV